MAQPIWELIVKDPALKEAFRELGERMSLGLPEDGRKAGNFDARYIVVTFSVANTEHRITHGLGRPPVALLPVLRVSTGKAVGPRIEVTREADSKYLYLKSSEAATLTFLIW